MPNSYERHRSYTDALPRLLAQPGAVRNKLIVTAGDDMSGLMRRAAMAGARGIGCDLICLEFDPAARKTAPRNVFGVFALGNAFARRDCVLWAADDEAPLALVPMDQRFDEHYRVGPTGRFIRITGRPGDLDEGVARAARRLNEAARAAESRPPRPGMLRVDLNGLPGGGGDGHAPRTH